MSSFLGQAENIFKNAGCWMACKIFREAVREVRVINISRSEQKGAGSSSPWLWTAGRKSSVEDTALWQAVHFEEKTVSAGVEEDGISCPPGLCVSHV